MSVAKRLWKILRAEVKDRGESVASSRRDGVSKEQRRGGARSEAAGSDPIEHEIEHEMPGRVPSGVDPVLAGYYANLEVAYGADLDTVEAAWKRLMRKYHPDRHAEEGTRSKVATELSKKLNHAYAQLRRHLAAENAA